MRQWTHAIALAMIVTACRPDSRVEPDQGSPATPPASQESAPQALPSPYARDVERICYCQERSGALDRPEAERVIVVAQWLGANLESKEGRTFLAEVSRVPPAEKVIILDREAHGLGLPGCPLARTWAAEPASSP
jgi:hypothetical protein